MIGQLAVEAKPLIVSDRQWGGSKALLHGLSAHHDHVHTGRKQPASEVTADTASAKYNDLERTLRHGLCLIVFPNSERAARESQLSGGAMGRGDLEG